MKVEEGKSFLEIFKKGERIFLRWGVWGVKEMVVYAVSEKTMKCREEARAGWAHTVYHSNIGDVFKTRAGYLEDAIARIDRQIAAVNREQDRLIEERSKLGLELGNECNR